MAAAIPGVRATRTTPLPSARTPAASGGRFGPQRTASSRANRTRTGRPCSSARRRATAPTSLADLAAERAAVGQRASPARRRARTTTHRSPGSRARPTSCAACAPTPRPAARAATAAGRWSAGPAPCRPRLGPRSASRRPPTPPCDANAPRPARRAARCRRRSRPGRARPPRRRPAARGPRSSPAAPRRRPIGDPGVRRGSAAPDRRAPPRGWSASRCTGRGGPGAPGRPPPRSAGPRALAPASRTMIPGVQNPHWLAPAAVNASAHRPPSSSPSTVVTCRPATRRAGVTQATRGWPSTSTVQQPHCPCGLQPSFGDRMPSRSRSASSSEQPSSGTSTGRPSTTKASEPATPGGYGSHPDARRPTVHVRAGDRRVRDLRT